MKKRIFGNYFEQLHPMTLHIYFICVLVLSMKLTHPIFLIINVLAAVIYFATAIKLKELLKSVIYMLPMVALILIINPLFNHRGNTQLIYINDRPITLEVIIYSVFIGLLIISLFVWFKALGNCIDTYKFQYIFGRVLPTISLMIMMIMRFIPYFSRKLEEIRKTQKIFNKSNEGQGVKKKIFTGSKMITMLTSITLEDSIEIAASMQSRGYGLGKRGHYARYGVEFTDYLISVFSIIITITMFVFSFRAEYYFRYYPEFNAFSLDGNMRGAILIYSIFLLIPAIFNLAEGVKWHILTSKI